MRRIILSSVACPAVPQMSVYLINGTIFAKKVFERKNVCFYLLYRFAWKISHFKNSSRFYDKCTYVFMQITRYFCQILTNMGFFWQSFENYSNIKFNENPFSGSRVVPCERKDRQTRRSWWSLFAILRMRLTVQYSSSVRTFYLSAMLIYFKIPKFLSRL